MNDLLARLGPVDNRLPLRPASPALGPLGPFIVDAVDGQGQLVLYDLEPTDSSTAEQLLLRARARVLGVETSVKARFQFRGSALESFVLIAEPPADWRLSDSFPELSPFVDGSGVALARMPFTRPLFVLAANEPVVTDAEYGLKDEAFAGGLNLYASGLVETLPLDAYRLGARLGAFDDRLAAGPSRVKGHFSSRDGMTLALQCWWRPASVPTCGTAKILSWGLEFRGALRDTGAGPWPARTSWLWELQLPSEPSFFVTAPLPDDPQAPLVFDVRFDSAQVLNGGINALASLTGPQQDLSSVLPGEKVAEGKRHPAVGISSLSFCPNRWLAVNLVLIDAATGGPYRWEAMSALSIDAAELALTVTSEPDASLSAGVLGVIELKGHRFFAEWYPGAVLIAELLDPVTFDVSEFLSAITGQPLGLPAVNLSLVRAEYERDLFGEGTTASRYAVTLAGHVDVLGNGKFLIESVGFEAEIDGDSLTRRAVTGGITLAGTPVSVTGEYTADTGWEFEGTASLDCTLSLHKLADELLEVWGGKAPPGLPDVTLEQVGLRFGAGRAFLRVWAWTKWQQPDHVPWGSRAVEVLVDVRTERDAVSGQRQTDLDLHWTQAHGTTSFQCDAAFGHQGTTFFLSWAGGKDETLGLGSLHALLNLKGVFDLPEGGDWSIFDFHRLTLAYTGDPRLVRFRAASSLGQGELTIEAALAKDRRSFAGIWAADPTRDGAAVGIGTLLEAIGLSAAFHLPPHFGRQIFDFRQLSFRYESDGTPSLQFVGESTDDTFYKDAFLVAQKGDQGWGFIVGVAFRENTKLENIPGVSEVPGLTQALGLLSIEPAYLCFSSIDAVKFLPPVSPGQNPFTQATVHLQKGVTVAARVNFTNSSNAIFRNVHTLIGIEELDGTLAVGGDHFALTALIPNQLRIPTGAGDDLVLSDAFFGMSLIEDTPPTLQVGGSTHFHLFGKTRLIGVTLNVNEAAAEASLHLQDIPLPGVGPLPGVRFKDECWLEVGAQFEPEGLDMGFLGDFYIGDKPTEYTGKAVFVLEMVEEVPNPLYAQFSIDALDLWAMFEAMTGVMHRLDEAAEGLELVDASISEKTGIAEAAHLGQGALEFLKHQYKNLQVILDKVAFRDAAFHWADSLVILPDGSTATPGVGFRGRLDLFGWETFAAFEFSLGTPTKLSGHFEMTPVHLLNVLSITGDGQGVLRREATGQQGADWKVKGKEAIKQRPALSGADYVIPPGGPVFIVSSQHSPFLHADIHVALFDLLHADVRADVDEQGLSFRIAAGVGEIAKIALGCTLRTTGGLRFEACGSFALHLRADIPIDLPLIPKFVIPLSAGLDAEIDLVITDGTFHCSISGSFEFEGVELHLPKLEITVPFPSFGDLPARILRHIEDNAEHIFADIVHGLGDLAEKGLHELEDVGAAVGGEVVKIGEGAAHAAAAVAKETEKAFHAMAQGVENAAKTLEDAAEAVKKEAVEAIAKIGADAEVAAKALLQEGEEALKAASETAATIEKAVVEEVAAVEHEIQDIANEAAHEVSKIVTEVAHEVQEVLDTAREEAAQVEKAAEAVAAGIQDAAKAVWGEAEQAANKAKDLAAKAWHGIEDMGESLGSGLKSVFSGW